MNITVIFGAMAMVGAVAAFWWGLTATPSSGASEPLRRTPPTGSASCSERLDHAPGRYRCPQGDPSSAGRRPGGEAGAGRAPLRAGPGSPARASSSCCHCGSAFLLILIGQPVFGLIAALVLFFLPDYWVMSLRDKRQDAIRSKAADTIDQLTICVEAGLGFDAALARVANTSEGPLADELQRTLSDIQAGVPRAQALRTMGDRVQIPEIRQLVTALLQAQKHGVPLAETLRIQSAEMRSKKQAAHRGEGGQAGGQDDLPDHLLLHAGVHDRVRASDRS